MSEATPETPAAPEGGNPSGATPAADEFQPITSQEEFDKALSKRLDRERAKFADYDDLKAQVKEVEKARKAAMTDAERAVAEAEERGRTAATTEFGKRLATAEIRAEAASANADLKGVFDYLDLARFVGDDGEPDSKAIKAFVAGLPKQGETPPPSFDGGAGTPAPGGESDMNKLIRTGLGRG